MFRMALEWMPKWSLQKATLYLCHMSLLLWILELCVPQCRDAVIPTRPILTVDQEGRQAVVEIDVADCVGVDLVNLLP